MRWTIVLSIVLFSCNRTASTNGSISSSLADGCSYNTSEDYILCISPFSDSRDSFGMTYELKNIDNDLILEGSINSGWVKWLDDYAIEIYETPGMISTELDKNDITQVFIVNTKKLMTKTAYLSL